MTNTTEITCPKCHGAKRFAAFAHINGGACFQCGGLGVVEASSVPASRTSTRKTTPIEALRALYRAGVSRRGEDRAEWASCLAEPFDAYSRTSGLTVARLQAACLTGDERERVIAAFRALGVDLAACAFCNSPEHTARRVGSSFECPARVIRIAPEPGSCVPGSDPGTR